MVRKIFFSGTLLFIALIIFPSSGIFGLFTDQSAAASNTFQTAGVFPTPTPTATPSSTPEPTPNPETQFPSCPKEPGANVNDKHYDVGYAEGIHWIVFQGLKFGSDYVYYIGPENDRRTKVLQCYYPLPRTDTGIQTNWLKKVTDIPGFETWLNGADFGLDSGPYLIQNINFSII